MIIVDACVTVLWSHPKSGNERSVAYVNMAFVGQADVDFVTEHFEATYLNLVKCHDTV